MVLPRGPLTLPYCSRRREPNVKNKLKKERGEVGRAREEGREGEGEVKQGHGHSLAVHFNYRTLPYPCISEMLIKGCFPEELSARLGPAHSTRLSWLLCKEAIASPQGNGSEFGSSPLCSFVLVSSQKAMLLSRPGRGGTGFTWEPAPETVDKAEMQGFLRRRRRRIPTSFHS